MDEYPIHPVTEWVKEMRMTTDEAIKEPCEYCKVLTPDMCCRFTLPSIHGDEDGDVVTITHYPHVRQTTERGINHCV